MKRGRSVLIAFIISALIVPVLLAEGGNIYRERREQVRKELKGGVALLFSGEPVRSMMGHYFRVDKNFYYLTGLKEPEAILTITEEGDILFIKKGDENKRKELSRVSGISRVLLVEKMNDFLSSLIAEKGMIYFPLPRLSIFSLSSPKLAFVNRMRKQLPEFEVGNLSPILIRMRMVKSKEELALMRRAIEITARGLIEAIRSAEPGMYEYQLQAVVEYVFHFLGAERTSFPSIVGSEPNSVIIHYEKNRRRIKPGELVVIDVGAEFKEYAGDLTRTIPISGRFTKRQKEIYEIVLEAQRRGIAAARPGATLRDVDRAARSYIKERGYGKYFIHGTSHFLGLDVHDPALPNVKLAPGMVITVEPGIYIPEENLGVRIEDDILITKDGAVVLSSFLPKRPEEIERLMVEKGVGNMLKLGAGSGG
ncbi:MAG: aminopeptidase P family protein [Acidobacteria bacterium]|nr:aminopeptidase P family protein [Acidobacteriota bacterium]